MPSIKIREKAAVSLIASLLVLLILLPPNTAASQPAAGDRDAIIITVHNPLPIARSDEIASIDWHALQQRLPDLEVDHVRVTDATTGEETPAQTLDADGDGKIDELLFAASYWPETSRVFRVEANPASRTPDARVYAAHIPERDDLAWENDRIAFRTYGQGLWELEDLISSGIDVLLKRTEELVIDRWYSPDYGNYHLDRGEGADFYTVGPTLGAGGTAIWHDDQLNRAENFAGHQIVANGPIRTIFELEYAPRDVGGVMISEVKRIEMDAGQHLFRQQTRFEVAASTGDSGAGEAVERGAIDGGASGSGTGATTDDGAAGSGTGTMDEITYAVGTVKRDGLVGSTQTNALWGWLSTWGPVNPSAGGHGRMGTAAILPAADLVEFREAEDHYVALATARPGEAAVQYVGAGWTAGGDFDTAEDWWEYLNDFVRRLENPLQISISGE